jgi:hypothetical protein
VTETSTVNRNCYPHLKRDAKTVQHDEQLLLLLASGSFVPTNESRIRELATKVISWSGLFRQAIEHGVHPLVSRNVQAFPFIDIPNQAREELATACRRNAVRNTLLSHELANLLNVIADSGVPVVPLKGLVLAQSLYGDTNHRVCGDTDLLVRRSHVPKALQILRRLGYEDQFDHGLMRNLVIRHGIEYELFRDQHGYRYALDLHWDLMLGWKLDERSTSTLWSETQPFQFRGSRIRVLSPEWELLYLAVHAANHQWQGLKWLIDIHDVCLSRSIDWDRLNNLAVRLEWNHILQLSLHYCKLLFGTPVPQTLSIDQLPGWAPAASLYPRAERIRMGFGPASVSFRLHLLSRFSQKLAYIITVLFIPTGAEERLVHLPNVFSFLYYPLRPLRLLARWLTQRWRNPATNDAANSGNRSKPE